MQQAFAVARSARSVPRGSAASRGKLGCWMVDGGWSTIGNRSTTNVPVSATSQAAEISANAANCAQICLQKTLRVANWGKTDYRGGRSTMIIVDIIDDMLSHDRAKAIKANLMPDSEIHCIQNVSTKKCTPPLWGHARFSLWKALTKCHNQISSFTFVISCGWICCGIEWAHCRNSIAIILHVCMSPIYLTALVSLAHL